MFEIIDVQLPNRQAEVDELITDLEMPSNPARLVIIRREQGEITGEQPTLKALRQIGATVVRPFPDFQAPRRRS